VGEINTRAVQVIERVQQKLTGRDFKPTQSLAVDAQVDRLIEQATSLSNLSQMFIGWSVPAPPPAPPPSPSRRQPNRR